MAAGSMSGWKFWPVDRLELDFASGRKSAWAWPYLFASVQFSSFLLFSVFLKGETAFQDQESASEFGAVRRDQVRANRFRQTIRCGVDQHKTLLQGYHPSNSPLPAWSHPSAHLRLPDDRKPSKFFPDQFQRRLFHSDKLSRRDLWLFRIFFA